MVRYLIKRPIAVLMIFLSLTIGGLLLTNKIPVSLLPNVDVPEIIVRINYPNTPAPLLEQNITKPLREKLANLQHLKNIESSSGNHTGILHLQFEYGTQMNLAYITVNEKLDQVTNLLPRDLPRPQVIRLNTSDIPVIRIQVIPTDAVSLEEVSAVTNKILKKRLEQIEGVSMVDINGKQGTLISVIPNKEKLLANDITESDLVSCITNANKEIGGLTVKDGQYRYFVKLNNTLDSKSSIETLPLRLKDGAILELSQLAKVEETTEKQTGYHLYNGKEGLVVTIQKQPGSRMNKLVPLITAAVEDFKKEFPKIQFALTQDQSFLLDAGISNLIQDLIYGGVLTILLLFVFLGNFASPILMSISIPISLIITFIFFYLFNISFNIISLSGLALGIGMLIDNSIVVIDNITRKRSGGLEMAESAVEGTNEMITPVISQVLTTVAVYAPLILLSDMAGALVFDQAIGLTISLGVSLMVAFVLAPLLYKLFLRTPPELLKEDTRLYKWVAKGYHKMVHHILQHKLIYFLLTLCIMPIGIWLARYIPVSALPKIEKTESLANIDWNAPVDAQENLSRTNTLLQALQSHCITTESEVGIKQFVLQQENNDIQHVQLYYACTTEKEKTKADEIVRTWLQKFYPNASLKILDAPNSFTQLFTTTTPYFEVRFKKHGDMADPAEISSLLEQIPHKDFRLGAGMLRQSNVTLLLDYEKLMLFGIERQVVEEALQNQFGSYTISSLKRFGEIKIIRLQTDRTTLESKLAYTVNNQNRVAYPLNYFITVSQNSQPKFLTADKTGLYQSIVFEKQTDNIPDLEEKIRTLAGNHGFQVDFTGQYFENKAQLKKLWLIFFIVLSLLYLILAIQYENLIQPLIVMLTIPLGITGGMFLLWITGGTLDVMAAIGFIVILGLIVDDPILKVETLNRLEKQYLARGLKHDNKLLEQMIHEAGDLCLKPLLMVSLTTSIAMVPVLFVGGIGNDLQKPLAIVIIGGLTIGTFFTTWFIPLAYWYVARWKHIIINRKS